MNELARSQGGTRDRLLEAALVCVRESGLAGATSRRITAEAGANLAAITYHFGSKEELVAQALLGAVRDAIEPALAVLRRDDLEPPARVLAAVDAIRVAFDRMAADAPAYVEALVQARHVPALGDGVRALMAELAGFMAGQIAMQLVAGELPGWVDPAAMARLILAVANGVVLQRVLDPGGAELAAVGGQFVGLLLASRVSPKG